MIRHFVLLKWNQEIDDAQLEIFDKAYAALPEKIPTIQNICHGPDKNFYPGNFNYVLMLDFNNKDDLDNYVASPAHAELLEKVVGPFLEGWAIAQIEI
ncbi:Dabb family protein [Litorivivens sp.]|uniref:Dabb family protein n=1 Tax=Litorivivens sp. TaxID=2020868 RepID=UPI003568B0D4